MQKAFNVILECSDVKRSNRDSIDNNFYIPNGLAHFSGKALACLSLVNETRKVKQKTGMSEQPRLARLLLKELATQLKAEDQGYLPFVVRLVGGDKPPLMTLSTPEVLLEPLFWPAVFAAQNLTPQDIESSWGVQGPMLLSLASALRNHYSPTNEWIEGKIGVVVRYAAMIARAYIAHGDVNVAPEEFVRQQRLLFDTASDVIDHLDWNRVRSTYGQKEATRFRLQCRTRIDSFARRNRGALASARRSTGLPGVAPMDDLEDGEFDGGDPPAPSTPQVPSAPPSNNAGNQNKKKKRRYR